MHVLQLVSIAKAYHGTPGWRSPPEMSGSRHCSRPTGRSVMITATVAGNVWSARRLPELPGGAFLEVGADGTGQRLIAY